MDGNPMENRKIVSISIEIIQAVFFFFFDGHQNQHESIVKILGIFFPKPIFNPIVLEKTRYPTSLEYEAFKIIGFSTVLSVNFNVKSQLSRSNTG